MQQTAIRGRGGGGSENYSLIQNIKFTASSEKIILAWQNPEQNYYGVKIAMTPAAGNLAKPEPCSKETNTFTVTSLNAGTEYTFTFTNLDSKQQETSSKISIVAETKTAKRQPTQHRRKMSQVLMLKLKIWLQH